MTKLETMIGFAAKSGQLISGSTAVEVAIKKGQVYLVICAGDLSARTIKNFNHLCELKQIPFYCYGSCSDLGHWIGKPGRGVIGIRSNHFAATVRSLFTDGGDSQ
ncbi:MAG TPA: 50S ribosomal protein L7ae [Firmicutes bacterium]|jgi:ribosomal protein L7Ae-like RNA K-turn-binding protein|nr:50S ribosomal protein L7ae [Bacillota bacterium]